MALDVRLARSLNEPAAAGASAIQLEDQTMPKRCGHLNGKTLVPAAEMVGKIKAALDARRSDDFLVIGRTDSIAVEGFDAAMDRAERYVEAGASTKRRKRFLSLFVYPMSGGFRRLERRPKLDGGAAFEARRPRPVFSREMDGSYRLFVVIERVRRT